MANKIIYGLSNVHIWKITATDATGKPTYGDVLKVPGAVSLSVSAEGDSNEFYADNIVYFQTVANNGYSGTLEMVDLPKSFMTTIMGELVGSTGTLFENTDTQPSEFALAFEFNGDANVRRHLFYRVKASRPDIASSTKQASIEPNTLTLNITCMAREDTHIVKARCEQGDTDYANWYTVPVEYTAAP